MSVNASGFLKETIIKTVRKHKDEISFVLHGSNGWEKWFQVALAAELKCNGAKDVEIEKVNDFNLNKKNTNTRVDKHYKRAYIDIVFRMKDTIKGRLVAVEIKQGNSPKNIQQVYEDIIKIRALRGHKWPYRAVCFVFLYHEKQRINKFAKLMEDLNQTITEKDLEPCIKIDFKKYTSIPEAHGLHCFIITWNAGTLQNKMTNKNYCRWFNEIHPIFNSYDISGVAKGRSKIRIIPDNDNSET